MWKHFGKWSAETIKNNPEEFLKSSSSLRVLCFFPFGILEKKTSQKALLIFGFKTFKLVFVTGSCLLKSGLLFQE